MLKMKKLLCFLSFSLIASAEDAPQRFSVDYDGRISNGVRHFQGWLQILPKGELVKSDEEIGRIQKFETNSHAGSFRLYVSLLSEEPPIQTRMEKEVSADELLAGVRFRELFADIGSIGVYSVPNEIGSVAIIGAKMDPLTKKFSADNGIYFIESVSGGWLPIGNFCAGSYLLVPHLTPEHKPIIKDVKLLTVKASDIEKIGQKISRFDWSLLPVIDEGLAKKARLINTSKVEELIRDREANRPSPKPDSGESP